MLVIPAIDVLGGRVVRLVQGDFQRVTVYDTDPLRVAGRFAQQGAQLLHVVDLDGARAGYPVNLALVARIAAVTSLPVQVGGGLRDEAAVTAVLAVGAARAILGTAAAEIPPWLGPLAARRPGRIIAALDSEGAGLATRGWLAQTGESVLEAAGRLLRVGVTEVIHTEVARDGTELGLDLRALNGLRGLGCRVIVAGGVGSLEDVRRAAAAGADGVIVGRAFYEGRFNLKEAMACALQANHPLS